MSELFEPDLPPCPKSGHKPNVKHTKSSLIVVWHRIHCLFCPLVGVGAETYEEAAEKWRKLCAGWNK